MLKFNSHIFAFKKKDYIRKDKKYEMCPLCCICLKCLKSGNINNFNIKSKDINTELAIFYTENIACCVNLFPYNSGHIMLFPIRHIKDIREMNENEQNEINYFTKIMLDILDIIYKPSGYNIGYNLGEYSGASIEHIHLHIIPRFKNELGFIDIIGGSKVIIEEPVVTLNKLKDMVKNFIDEKKIKEQFEVKIP